MKLATISKQKRVGKVHIETKLTSDRIQDLIFSPSFTNYAQYRSIYTKKETLEQFVKKGGTNGFVPFDLREDYLKYVDGKPRGKGVKDFLASCRIDIPHGSDNDSPDMETLCGLGNRTVVVEDAVSGVEAGKKGVFCLLIVSINH